MKRESPTCTEQKRSSRVRTGGDSGNSAERKNLIERKRQKSRFILNLQNSQPLRTLRRPIHGQPRPSLRRGGSGMRASRIAHWKSVKGRALRRGVGSCRGELLDHVIALNESHVKRLLVAITTTTTARTVDFRNRHPKSDRVAQLEVPCSRGLVSEVFIIVTTHCLTGGAAEFLPCESSMRTLSLTAGA
jgi:hypothetical protein